jgi:dipeptidyl aminopeptidase/acylaminoacyl peptidase
MNADQDRPFYRTTSPTVERDAVSESFLNWPRRFACRVLLCGAIAGLFDAKCEPPQASPQPSPRSNNGLRRVFNDQVNPHWFANGNRFWYRNDLRHGAKLFVLVDAVAGTRAPAFDHARLASALSKAAGTDYNGDNLPFEHIESSDDAKEVRFNVGDVAWKCDLTSYQCIKVAAESQPADKTEKKREEESQRRKDRDNDASQTDRSPRHSPDGKWTAFLKDHNIFISSREDEAKQIQLSQDGTEHLGYGEPSWSPDSQTVLAFRIEPGNHKEVYLIQSSPPGGGRAKLKSRPYTLPGDKFAKYEVNLFEIANGKQIKPEMDRFEHEWLRPRLHWKKDGHHFMYQQVDRGHQRFRVIEVDARTGSVRNIIDEKSNTFIWTAHTENLNLDYVNWLKQTDEIIYVSESSGWRHLYLVDASEGKIKNALTSGDWIVRGIDRIDETNRQVWFQASGVFEGQDPYLVHYGRVNFDGTGLVWLTAGDGNHSVQFSPDRKYIVDTYSRVDRAPVNELRRVSDGKIACKLEEADITDLTASGWQAPEVFVAKGRDGTTDIWGIICRPYGMDTNTAHPIIEDIYAGPQGSFVPKTFSASSRYESLNKLGFVVVKIDGMGTANRSKAFHDVCWHNLKDAGFEDRILWMKAAAKKYPYLDISRVGVYGTSAGGQSAAGAVLFHPEFYKAAVANCGCHDNRMDKASWNEQWMGYPIGPQYSESSNIDNAARLRGHLFLIVGELDDNVPPESTYRFVDALMKANKDFDFLVVPNGGHGSGGAYAAHRREDFFVRHLLGKEPPNRNASQSESANARTE